MPDLQYIIACGDEGVRVSGATRLGVVGAGAKLPHIDELYKAIKKIYPQVGVFANQENDWIKQQLALSDYESADASMQQHIAALCDLQDVKYLGNIEFVDPVEFGDGVKAHMVRPHGIHVAKQISLTIGGGEQKFNLGNFVVSADWVSGVKPEVAKEILQTEIEFYRALRKKELPIVVEDGGELSDEMKAKNREVLQNIGLI